MNEQNNIEETLWSYIDGSLDEPQVSFVDKLVQTDAVWRSKYEELLELHQLVLDSAALEQPSMRFTQNVMEQISKHYITPAATNYINKNVIRGIGLFFLISIAGLLVYGFGQVNWQHSSNTALLNQLDWSKFYSSAYTNIFIVANILLGLMLLDMVLTQKKRKNLANP